MNTGKRTVPEKNRDMAMRFFRASPALSASPEPGTPFVLEIFSDMNRREYLKAK